MAILRSRGARIALLALLLPRVAASGSAAEDLQLSEAQVKAAFLYNFATFVEWPAEALDGRSTFRIGLVGSDPFRGLLNELRGRPANGRPIEVGRLKTDEEAGLYQLLFFAEQDDERVQRLLAQLDGAPVLTVGESYRFLRAGGIVRLFIDDSKVRFEIDADRASRAGLRVSSKVLSLARVAGRESRPLEE